MIRIQIGMYIKDKCMLTWALKPNKIPKHHLIWWRNVGWSTFFVCICFVIAPKSRYLKSVNHKMVMWSTNRPMNLYFTIFFNFLFLYFPNCSLNRICCYLFSADTIIVFMYNFIHIRFLVIYSHWPSMSSQNGRRHLR